MHKSDAVVKVERVITIDVPGLGAKIREARKRSGMKATDIASAAGMSVQNWYRVEGELQTLPESTLRRIEEVLNADFGVVFPDQ